MNLFANVSVKYISPKLKESFTEQFMKHLDSFRALLHDRELSNCYVPPVL